MRSSETQPLTCKAATEEVPQRGLSRFFHIFGSNFWELIKLNFIATIFCLPILTIPAVATAMSYVCNKMVTNKPYHVWGDFWHRFKTEFLRSLFAGSIYAVISAALGYMLFISVSALLRFDGIHNYLLAALSIVGLGVCFQASVYTFSLMGIVQLPISDVLLNSLRLTAFRPLMNMLSFFIFVLLTALMVLTFPFTLPLVFFVYAGPLCYSTAYIAKDAIEKCIRA